MDKQDPGPIDEAFVFTRRLSVEPGERGLDPLLEALRGLHGLVSAQKSGRGRLILRYDASRLQLDTLIQGIERAGGGLRAGFWQRVRLGWYRFVDNNALTNATRTDVHCCNKPPRGR